MGWLLVLGYPISFESENFPMFFSVKRFIFVTEVQLEGLTIHSFNVNLPKTVEWLT